MRHYTIPEDMSPEDCSPQEIAGVVRYSEPHRREVFRQLRQSGYMIIEPALTRSSPRTEERRTR